MILEKIFADVSFYQLVINWDVMRTKSDAVIVRMGQNLWEDSQFRRNWAEAKRVKMRRGCYWFFDDRVSPGKQAEIVFNLIKDDLPEMEVWVDWERTYGGQFSGLSNVVAMMQAIERALPTVTVGLYTGFYWFKENSNPILNVFQYAYLKNKPLWLAYYAAASKVQIPAPWTKLTHWQFGTPAVGLEWGVKSKEIDLNYFNGTETEFALRYGGLLPGEGEPPQTGEPIMDKYVVVWDAGANTRPQPSVNNNYIRTLPKGTQFDVVEYYFPAGKTQAQEHWGKLPSGEWVALVYNSTVRATLVSAAPAPVGPPNRVLLQWDDAAGNVVKELTYLPE